MKRNLELKAIYPTVKGARSVCRRIGARAAGILKQTDTYFKSSKGRVKLREINGREFELIYYRRGNRRGTRYSDYIVVPLKGSEPMKELCTRVFGVRTVVKKTRRLYLFHNARVHIDSVARLGTFLEFEVIVGQSRRQARNLMNFLVDEFKIPGLAVVGVSYSDLMMKPARRKRLMVSREKALAKPK